MDGAIELMLEQDECRSRTALETTLKLVNNILGRQDELKFRKLRRSNEAIRQKVLDVAGAEKLLGLIGFEVMDDDLVLPLDASICLLYTSPSPRDLSTSRMPSSA